MTLKWVSAILAASALGVFATANLVSQAGVPLAVNLVLVAAGATGAVVVVIAELYLRLDARMGAMIACTITRLDDLATGLGPVPSPVRDQSAAPATDATIIPLAPRRSR